MTPYQLFGPLHWREIPPKMRHDYTLDHKIPVKVVFMDDTKPHKAGAASGSAGVVAYNGAAINAMVQQVKQGLQVCRYSGLCSNAFRDALKVYSVEGKSVVILGSETPWAEAYFIAAGAATVTTVDYRDPSYRHPKLRFLHIDELSKGTESFDVAVSYSSFEHDGLGRYGDPLHPNADLIRMQQVSSRKGPVPTRKPGIAGCLVGTEARGKPSTLLVMRILRAAASWLGTCCPLFLLLSPPSPSSGCFLGTLWCKSLQCYSVLVPVNLWQAKNIVKPGGLMFLGVPNGKDYLVFNAHRVYGPIRFPMLIKGWKLLRTFGGDLQQVYASNVDAGFQYQLLHVLAPE